MTEQDKIEAIEKFLNKQLKGVDKETLRQYDNGELEYRDSGNLEDCFDCGCNVGYDVAVQEIAEQVFEIINRSENKGE